VGNIGISGREKVGDDDFYKLLWNKELRKYKKWIGSNLDTFSRQKVFERGGIMR
jgi:hypothetical protein